VFQASLPEQFAHKENIRAVDDLRPQGAIDRQFLEGKGGAQVGESAEGRAQAEQAGLGALVGGEGVEFVAAHRSQQDRIGGQSRIKSLGRQRRTVLHNRHAADAFGLQFERVAAQGRNLLQYGDCFASDFGADAITGRDQNLQLHACSLCSECKEFFCLPSMQPVERQFTRVL
jgi:hypothetical protein